jgi:hypothetical protein
VTGLSLGLVAGAGGCAGKREWTHLG